MVGNWSVGIVPRVVAMTPRKILSTSVPKPRKARTPKKRFSSIPEKSYAEKIAASQRLRSTTPPKKKRAKSKAEKVAKLDREYGGPERIAWVAQLPCVGCGYRGPVPRENAHVISGGTSRKADARWIVPLCARRNMGLPASPLGVWIEGCHRKSHRMGQKSFEAFANIDLKAAASRIESEWQAHAFSKSEGR